MVDAAQNTETKIETENLATESPDQDVNRFQGYATRDGERLPAPTSVPAVPADKPQKAKAAEKADDAAESDDSGDDGSDGGDDNQRHKSAQARINKAVGKQRAAERRAEAAERRAEAAEARTNSPQQGNQDAAPAAGNKEPNPAEYEHGELDARYIRDLTRWEVKQELAAADKNKNDQAKQTEMSAEQQRLVAARDDFLMRGLDIADDFEEVVTNDELKIHPVLGDLALESELGPKIIYEAVSDPKEAKKLSAMSPARQAAWFGIKEAELSSASSGAEDEDNVDETTHGQSSTMTTQAPEPMKAKPKGNGKAQPASADTNDFAAFERMATTQQ